MTLFAALCELCWSDVAVLGGRTSGNRSQGLVILGVGAQDTAGDLGLMARKLGLTFPLGSDGHGDLAARPYRLYIAG